MSDLVSAEEIERVVGAPRHQTLHQARAVSAEQTVYVLHSYECLVESQRLGRDLRQCPFSLALDNGIRPAEWREDLPCVVGIEGAFDETRLVQLAVDSP